MKIHTANHCFPQIPSKGSLSVDRTDMRYITISYPIQTGTMKEIMTTPQPASNRSQPWSKRSIDILQNIPAGVISPLSSTNCALKNSCDHHHHEERHIAHISRKPSRNNDDLHIHQALFELFDFFVGLFFLLLLVPHHFNQHLSLNSIPCEFLRVVHIAFGHKVEFS